MKKAKRILSLVLAVMLVMSVLVFPASAEASVECSGTGLKISEEDFRNNFSGNPNSRVSAYDATRSSTLSFILSNIEIVNNDVRCVVKIANDLSSTTLPISGTLHSSYKLANNVNSAIVDASTTTTGFDILLFEIFNDTANDNLLVSSLDGVPHIKIYLKDSDSNIYLFEEELPTAFKNVNAALYSKANKSKDALWAVDLVEHTTRELVVDEVTLQRITSSVQTRGLNSWSTWTGSTYYDSYYVGSEYVQAYSTPYLEYKHVNVSSSDSTWIASFKVDEYTKVGETEETSITYYGINPIEYRNLSISFGCGDNSTFIRSYQSGKIRRTNGSAIYSAGSTISVNLLKKAVSSLPIGSTISTVLACINSMTSATGSVTLGSTGVSLYGAKTTAVGEKLTNYVIDEDTSNGGHYFTYQAVLQYEAAGGNTSTVGALKLSFNKYFSGDSSSTAVTRNFTLNYSAQA